MAGTVRVGRTRLLTTHLLTAPVPSFLLKAVDSFPPCVSVFSSDLRTVSDSAPSGLSDMVAEGAERGAPGSRPWSLRWPTPRAPSLYHVNSASLRAPLSLPHQSPGAPVGRAGTTASSCRAGERNGGKEEEGGGPPRLPTRAAHIHLVQEWDSTDAFVWREDSAAQTSWKGTVRTMVVCFLCPLILRDVLLHSEGSAPLLTQ